MLQRYTTSLRATTLRAIAATAVLLFVLLTLTSESLIMRSFLDLEEHGVRREIAQTLSAIENEIAALDRTTFDYAAWDESYAFVAGQNPEYVATNLVDETMVNNRITYIAFVNRAGELVFARRFNLMEQREMPPPQSLASFTGSNAALLQHQSVDSAISGIIMVDDQPMLVAARPILTSAVIGPPNGTLIMGRDLNTVEIARIAAITGHNLTIIPAASHPPDNGFALARQLLGTSTSTLIRPLSTDQIAGYAAIRDIRDSDGILLRIDMPREIYQHGLAATRYYLAVLLLATLGFTIVILLILERRVLARIISLGAQVARIGDAKDAQKRVVVAHHDEISHLGIAINTMLDDLERAARRLEQSDARYRQLIEITPETIVVHDGVRITYVNPAGARLFGVADPTGLIGQPATVFLPPQDQPADSGPAPYERTIPTPGGAMITLEMVAVPLTDRDAPAWQVVGRNITERKQTETALREARDAADAANRSKTRFLASMSHELRTPLTSILGYAELIAKNIELGQIGDIRSDIDRVQISGRHLLALINDLLDLSKIEAERLELNPTTFVVAALAREVTQGLQLFAQNRNNSLHLTIDPTIQTMRSDQLRLRQILFNLLHNACKFTENGTVTLAITRDASAEGRRANGQDARICFAVSDSGIGLTGDQIAGLFQDFTQAAAITTHLYGGTGLGLALSRRLSILMGGDLTVVSELGQGATFRVILPETLPEPRSDQHSGVMAPAPPLAISHDSFAPKQLALLINADPEARPELLQALNRPDIHVETAAAGSRGIELARILLPDLIILDILLPEPDCWSILAELKAAPETAAIPVLLLAVGNDIQRGILLGVAELLTEPPDYQRLECQIQSALHGRQAPHILLVEDNTARRNSLQQTLQQAGWTTVTAGDGPAALASCRRRMPEAIVLGLLLAEMSSIEFLALLHAMPGGEDVPIIIVAPRELTAIECDNLNRAVRHVQDKAMFHNLALLPTVQRAIADYTRSRPTESVSR